MKNISFVKRFSCSDNQYIILGLMELLRKEKLIGENNKFGGEDELLFHSGGNTTKKSTKSIIIGPSMTRFKSRQPSKNILPPNNYPVNPLKGKIILGPKPPNLNWEIEKWNNRKWNLIKNVGGVSLSKSLQKLEEYLPNIKNAPGTICGAFAYDLCQWTQPWCLINPPKENSLLGLLYSVERWIIHDKKNKFIEVGGGIGDKWVIEVNNLINSLERINEIQPNWPINNPILNSSETTNFSDKEHINKIKKAQESIKEGEFYQLNFGRKWKGDLTETPWKLQLRFAKENPAPWSSFLYSPDLNFSICSSSPELLIQSDGEIFSTSPIKGTKPRGESTETDKKLIEELINCPKERAEHLMLVDLERNDLSIFCELGSVYRNSFQVESYAQVHHLVSDITGKIRKDLNVWDALESMFPGGSISGCPKTVTIAAIDQLEGEPRSFWTGSMGIINHKNKSLSLNILIRTLEAHNEKSKWKGIIQAGGGLVIGSNPKTEVKEAKLKADILRKITGWIENKSEINFPIRELSTLKLNTHKKSKENENIGKLSIWPNILKTSKKQVAFIDNLDSFSWNIINELSINGANVCLIPGRDIKGPKFDEIIKELNPTHIVLGPGPGNPNISELTMEIAKKSLSGGYPPLLGICLGHQAIGVAAGWEINKTLTGAVHGEVHKIENIGSSLFDFENKMTRYHSLSLIKPKKDSKLKVVAKLANNEDSVMAIEHEIFPIFGVQFHPESEESEGGEKIFEKFLKY